MQFWKICKIERQILFIKFGIFFSPQNLVFSIGFKAWNMGFKMIFSKILVILSFVNFGNVEILGFVISIFFTYSRHCNL